MLRTKRVRMIMPASLFALVMTGCNWLSLAKNALTYPTIQRGEAANVVAGDSLLYASQGANGLAIVDARSGQIVATLATPPGSESIDDIALDGPLLFALDAEPPGYISVYALGDPRRPQLVSGPRAVAIGPFSGIAADSGLCVVSGGTSRLTAWRYDSIGTLIGPTATADLGRGQPDATVAPDGRSVYVSTHFWGPYFGVDFLRDTASDSALTTIAELRLDGAGFTAGGAKPANFPIEAAAFGTDTVLIAHAQGLAVIRTAGPTGPTVIEVIDVGGKAVNVDTHGAFAAVAVTQPNSTLVVLDFSRSPVRVARRFPLPP